jgi:Protein of unknown function (DUF2800)
MEKKFHFDEEREDLPSASHIESFFLCPGKYNAEKGLPSIQNEDADRGTRIHDYLAGKDIKLDKEEQNIADQCFDQARTIAIDWRALVQEGGIEKEDIFQFFETRYWMEDASLERQLSGKVDVVMLAGKAISNALIIDYKTGRNDAVESARNEQLRTLAILLWGEYPTLKEIRVGIVQPLVSSIPEVCDYDETTINIGYRRLITHLEHIKTPNARRVPGERQCKYCKAKLVCPEAKQVMLFIPEVNKEITAYEMSDLLDRATIAQQIVDAIKNKGKEMAIAGIEIPGYSLKKGNERRIITDAKVAYNALKDYVDESEFRECCSITIGKLEDVLSPKLSLKGNKLKDKVNALLNNCMKIEENAPSLKRL